MKKLIASIFLLSFAGLNAQSKPSLAGLMNSSDGVTWTNLLTNATAGALPPGYTPSLFGIECYNSSTTQWAPCNLPNSSSTSPQVFNGPITAPAFVPQNTTAGPQQYFFDDFYNVVNANAGTIGAPTGNACAATNTDGSANHPGRMLLTSGTAGTGTGEVCFVGFSGAGDFNLNTAPAWTKESDVFIPVLPGTTAAAYQFGSATGTSASPWTTGIGFYLSSANAVVNDWYCEIATTYTDSTVAAVASTWTRLTLVSDGTNLHYYINGTQVCGTGTAISGIPSGNIPAGAWTTVALSATSVTMAVDYLTSYRAVVR